jgi:hypothetical protein
MVVLMAATIADRWQIEGRPAAVIVEPPPRNPDPTEPTPAPFPAPFPQEPSEPDRRPTPFPRPTLP